MSNQKSLSATQIRFLKIGPRVNGSNYLKQQLYDALQEENKQQNAQFSAGIGNLNKIPKYGHTQLSRTVSNFGILMNHNFGNSSRLHQMQKFGRLAKVVDKSMQIQKDKQFLSQKNSNSRVQYIQDERKFIKSIYNYQGQKIFITLHSFSIQLPSQNYKQVLPFSFLKQLVSKVPSSKLSKILQSSYQIQSSEINYQKLVQKSQNLFNHEQKYHNVQYKFDKLDTQIVIRLPYLEFSHLQTDYKSIVMPANKDILQIIADDFNNVHDIVEKYFNHNEFLRVIGRDYNGGKQDVNMVVVEQQENNQAEQNQDAYVQPRYSQNGDNQNNQDQLNQSQFQQINQDNDNELANAHEEQQQA